MTELFCTVRTDGLGSSQRVTRETLDCFLTVASYPASADRAARERVKRGAAGVRRPDSPRLRRMRSNVKHPAGAEGGERSVERGRRSVVRVGENGAVARCRPVVSVQRSSIRMIGAWRANSPAPPTRRQDVMTRRNWRPGARVSFRAAARGLAPTPAPRADDDTRDGLTRGASNAVPPHSRRPWRAARVSMGAAGSCLGEVCCGADPFLQNSKHYHNREDFSLALRRNDSFTFFSVRVTRSATGSPTSPSPPTPTPGVASPCPRGAEHPTRHPTRPSQRFSSTTTHRSTTTRAFYTQ